MVRRHKHHVEEARIVQAIEDAERHTSGQIRVSIANHVWGDVRKAAHRTFERLGMTRTADRNGVLVFVVPSQRRFAIVGDRGIHEKVGQQFWERVSAAMSETIRASDLTDGIVHAVREAGAQLAAHFPHRAGTGDTLPDTVDER